MLDPFTAVGLAGNIITFIDFTRELLSGARAIYRSHSRTSDENAVLGVIARDVSSLSDKVIVEQARSEDLRALATESKRVAEDLVGALEKLKVEGSNTRWASFKVALKDVWNRGEIEDLERRLEKLQVQVTAHLQHLMGNKMSEVSVAVSSLAETNSLLRLDTKELATIKDMIKDILGAIKALQASDGDRSKSNDPMQSLSLAVSSLSVHGQTMAYDLALLGSLHFPMIQVRHERIAKAHAETYEWIFREPRTPDSTAIGFAEWLEQGNGMFWIYGKPGCGKSTLMKFICHHDQTGEHLGRWAESHSKGLVTAKHFFWNAGSALQKSQEGLLRSLLFEVLRQCPELVGHVRRTRSKHRGYSGHLGETEHLAAAESWSVEELFLTLQDAIGTRMSATFCLFIDGLDEYVEENKHTHRNLIDTLHRIAQSPNVKICASSRPWSVFWDAFEDMGANSLKLEDLTRGDIRRFVSDEFKAHKQFRRLSAHDPGYVKLIEEVATRSQGVFLWVYLVVKDLLDGLTYNDPVQAMLRRLDQFPAELEDFFHHMIESIPAFYRRQAARTFMITMTASEPLLLTVHSFLDDIEADPEFCTNKPQAPMEDEEVDFKQERMWRQLDGQTKGLLEVVYTSDRRPYFSARVDFLHRTVKDFLLSSGKVQSFMTNGQQGVSDTWVLVCRGILAEIRYAPERDLQLLNGFLGEFAHFAEKALHDTANEGVVVELFKAIEGSEKQAMSRLADHDDGKDGSVFMLPQILCKHGLVALLKHMDYDWSQLSKPAASSEPLILSVLTSLQASSETQLAVVDYLLGRGADPNQLWENQQPWKLESPFQRYLDSLCGANVTLQSKTDIIPFQIVAALVAHGADLSARIGQWQTKTARDVIQEIFPPDQADRILASSPLPKEEAQQQQPWLTQRFSSLASLTPTPKPTATSPSRGFRASLRGWLERRPSGRQNG
ncbi:hypothetical protein C8A05DRAFT_18559 [Staphylotrichum tortipilum]|uniref:NACHT domain-containing protein n=1 Tax=Staphylotrichum tortipilum TaxID=2831512 RepID=A0AAN6RQY6_9PEZI|nr:hypothetical protein C8A05DRAFT_18559 [Staphylotrichum longicolle]